MKFLVVDRSGKGEITEDKRWLTVKGDMSFVKWIFPQHMAVEIVTSKGSSITMGLDVIPEMKVELTKLRTNEVVADVNLHTM